MTTSSLPTLNAGLNLVSAILLTLGYINIKKGRPDTHRRFMISALISSALFLVAYSIYHSLAGSVPYPHYDWTRPLYFVILIPHIILAAVMVPFIIAGVWFALKGKYEMHKKIMRWIWPVWMFVSVSGIMVYLMLYRL